MHSWVKRGFVGVGSVLGIAAVGGGAFVYVQTSAFDASMAKVYDVPLPSVTRSTDAAVIERGKHLAESVAACTNSDCHGADLAGGKTISIGPVGTITGPNMTEALPRYSDGELARIIRHGIKKDGTSVHLMPSQEFGWLPMEDVTAIVSYLRTVPKIDKPNGPITVGVLGKVLDRQNKFPMDVARRIDHAARAKEAAPKPEPTATYGAYLAKSCNGCHGDGFSGGPIPGAPPSMPIPKNLTPDATGLKGWAFSDFERVCNEGVSKDGRKLDPFMPYATLAKMNDTEKKALWAYLQSVPPKPFGQR